MSKIRRRFLSAEETLFEDRGLYSNIRVGKKDGRINLYTGRDFLQSSVDSIETPRGTLFDWYLSAPWFSGNFEGYLNSLLILGLGAGSQVKLYNKIYKVKIITGVEIDPLIIDLGKKFFDLNAPNLKTVNGDICSFLDTTPEIYSLIILDAFKENIFEENCQSPAFFRKVRGHLAPAGVFLVNKVLKDSSNREIEKELKKIFNTAITLRIYNNLFILATNSPTAPKGPAEVGQLILEASRSNRALGFFRSLKLKDIRIL